jgi:hypothetical protein
MSGNEQMSKKKLSVGDDLEANCTRCRTLMNHTLVAMVEGRPVRVKCNTCGGEHAYRTPVPVKTARAPKGPQATAPRRSRIDPKLAEQQEWEQLQTSWNPSNAVGYSLDGQFKLNSLVRHPVFGLGIVQQLPGGRKVEVLFKDGKKLLRCG